jgi:hypothetical protein
MRGHDLTASGSDASFPLLDAINKKGAYAIFGCAKPSAFRDKRVEAQTLDAQAFLPDCGAWCYHAAS